MTDRPPAPSIVFLFTFTDGRQEAMVSTYSSDKELEGLLRLLKKDESPVTISPQSLS